MSRTEVEALLLRLAFEHRPGTFGEKEPERSTQRRTRAQVSGRYHEKHQEKPDAAVATPRLADWEVLSGGPTTFGNYLHYDTPLTALRIVQLAWPMAVDNRPSRLAPASAK